MGAAKKISVVAFALIALLIGALIYVWSSIDAIVAAAIEKHGSQLTQTSVGVSGVKLELAKGAGAISGISVGNPSGFKQAAAFKLDNISTRIDVNTVTGNPVVIDEIVISGPEVFYEINSKGVSNFDVLKENMASAGAAASAEKETEAAGSGSEVKLVIKRLLIENGTVTAAVAALGDKTMNAKLPHIELKNIGQSQNGASGEEVARKILSALTSHTMGAVSTLGVDKYLGKAEEEVQRQLQQAGETAEGLTEELKKAPGDALKGLIGK